MRLFKLPDTVLTIKGNAPDFLKGLSSNDVNAPLNAFLNQHGRIIATFRQKKISDDEILISLPALAVEPCLKHLERYAKLSRARIEPSDQSSFIDLNSAQTVWTSQASANSISDAKFTLFRLDHGIPLMGVDYQADEFILNVHEYDYVSYTKGCYLGQEPVAKVHNRARPSRRLIAAFEDQCTPEQAAQMTSVVIDPQTKKRRGFVFVSNKSP